MSNSKSFCQPTPPKPFYYHGQEMYFGKSARDMRLLRSWPFTRTFTRTLWNSSFFNVELTADVSTAVRRPFLSFYFPTSRLEMSRYKIKIWHIGELLTLAVGSSCKLWYTGRIEPCRNHVINLCNSMIS